MDRKDLSFFLSLLVSAITIAITKGANTAILFIQYCHCIALHSRNFLCVQFNPQINERRYKLRLLNYIFSHTLNPSFLPSFLPSLSLSFQNKGTLHVSRRSSSSSHQPFTNRNPWIPTRTRTGIHDPHTPHGTIPRINPRRRHRNLRHEDPGRYDP